MEKYRTQEAEGLSVMEASAEYYPARDEINFNIIEHIGTLRTNASGWSREFSIVSWNGGKPKFDIRDWSADHTKMSKGITMTENELGRIYDWLTERGTKIGEQSEEKDGDN